MPKGGMGLVRDMAVGQQVRRRSADKSRGLGVARGRALKQSCAAHANNDHVVHE